MTVPVQPNPTTIAIGNGIATQFNFSFLCLESRDLAVSINGSLVAPSMYSLAGLGESQGGSVTFTFAPAAGARVEMALRVVLDRQIDYQDNGDLFAQTVNHDFDRIWLALQGTSYSLGRALQLGPYDVNGSGSYRANQNRIQDLADPQGDQDAVNKRSMVAFVMDYVDRAIAGIVGGFGWFLQRGVGAIFRTFQNKMRDVVDVRDFGAIGDGTLHTLAERYSTLAAAQADFPFVTSLTESIDGTAIQAALNAAFNYGLGQAGIGDGTYVVNRSISMRAGVTLAGDGKVVITQPNGLNLLTIIEGGTAHAAGVRGLVVDGNRDANAVDYNAVLVHVRAANDFKIDNCHLKRGCGYGVACNGARMSIVDTDIEDTFLHAIGMYGSVGLAARHMIDRVRIIRPCAGGIIMGLSDYSTISNTTIYAPIIGGRGNRLRVNISGTTVTWVSGPNFANVRPGEVIVFNNGAEIRVMQKISNTQLTLEEAPGTPFTNTLATIGCGDLVGVMSQFSQIKDCIFIGGATFGVGFTVGGNAVSTTGCSIQGCTFIGQGKHALAVGWDSGEGGVYDTTLKDCMIYNAGDAGGNGTLDRVPIYLSSQTPGKVTGVSVDDMYVVGPSGDAPCEYWMGTDGQFEVGSVFVGPYHSQRMVHPGILNDVLSVSLSGWGSTATATDIVSYGRSVRFTINCTGTGQTAGPAITVNKICDSGEQPAMVKADITTTTGTLGQMWGEHATVTGQWRATYYGTPVAGNLFTMTFRA